jgi:hypothetical protein
MDASLNGIVMHDAFVGQGCSGKQAPHPAVTNESGRAVWMDAYDAMTTKAGRYVQAAVLGPSLLFASPGNPPI